MNYKIKECTREMLRNLAKLGNGGAQNDKKFQGAQL